MTDITDATLFYVRVLGENQYAKIEKELDKFNPAAAQSLEKPIKKGTLCAAKFSVDNQWYRARVTGTQGKGVHDVVFIDFGNTESIAGDDLKKLPQSLL